MQFNIVHPTLPQIQLLSIKNDNRLSETGWLFGLSPR